MMAAMSQADALPNVAVAIPCYNEAAAIASVIRDWQEAMPGAVIVVFDNNSSDGTGEVARSLGIRVIPVVDQGKGHVVREIFRVFRELDAVIMIDGDGTYPASAGPLMLQAVLEGRADMVIGARVPVQGEGAMSPLRGAGNVLIRSAFRLFIGRGPGDLLSGYRVFSPRFLATVPIRSSGFEIETEIAAAAVFYGMRTIEIGVTYSPRIEGTVSKLRPFRDGRRILTTILKLSARERIGRLVFIAAASMTGLLAALYALSLWILRH